MRDSRHSAEQLWRGVDSDSDRIPVWLDCDTGHDDAFAALVAAHSPRLNLLGISTVYGNAPIEQTTANTLSILTAIQRTSIPVYPGSSHPFCRPPCFAPDIHGASGLDGTTCLPKASIAAQSGKSAIQAAYEALIATPPNTAYVVATGTQTNMGLLFSTYPDLASHIKGLHIMGGAVGSSFTPAPMGVITDSAGHKEERFGNWSHWAEFNIYCDPESALSLFAHPELKKKIMLVPLDLSHLFLATKDVQNALLHGFDTEPKAEVSMVRKLFNEILTFFAQTYADVFGLVQGPPLHDVLPVLAILAPEIFHDQDGERFAVDVVIDGAHGTDGIARTTSRIGQTVVSALEKGQQGVRIPRDLDGETAWRIIDLCLNAAEKTPK
ncbi:nucleoside hydrolase [Myriangium duriaei CBS 260.36]|uniref:Nucleoside hydrolase n=1 Tax=Myriangium duriaei CBS 260.36 TaxID=1168546 RepID=A0A9P4IY53_9PEZI|nr:nucleoside hydrolase [Myriangium duriaei CBS 260.36]